MAEYQVLHSEPRHKVDEYVDEILVRSRTVIDEMGVAFEGLLKAMIGQFQAFKEAHYLITLDDVKFEWIRWLKESGELLIEFGLHKGKSQRDPEDPQHVVVDAFVEDIVGRTVPASLRDEFSSFLRGMVMQFAVLKKHNLSLNLRTISFERIHWKDGGSLAIQVLYGTKPFTPQEARW